MNDEDVDILRRVKHKNIVVCIDYISSSWMNLRVMELGTLTLREYMKCKDLSHQLEQKLIRDLFEAVEYLQRWYFHQKQPRGETTYSSQTDQFE